MDSSMTATGAATRQASREGPRVVIVGGVAGGMSCATRLRRLDETARITVLERGPYVSYANCGIPYALSGEIARTSALHVQTPEKLAAWFDIDVHTGAEVVAVHPKEKTATVRWPGGGGTETVIGFDKLVLALGAEPSVPPPFAAAMQAGAPHIFGLHTIPDLQRIQAFITNHRSSPVTSLASSSATQGDLEVSVIGAGFIGLEAAENLARLPGVHVSVFEYGPHVLPPIDTDVAEPLQAEMRRQGVRLFLNSRIAGVTTAKDDPAEGVHQFAEIRHATATEGGHITNETTTRADLVIVTAGVRPRSALAKAAGLAVDPATGAVRVDAHMRTSDPHIYAIGDMVATPHLVAGRDMPLALAGPANRQGRLVANHICGLGLREDLNIGGSETVNYRGNVGAFVCRVFERVVAAVGLSTAALDRMPGMQRGKTYEYITIHPPSHAGYFPGSEPMTIKLAFEIPSGKLLGAQIVGSARGDGGVDKRIDVLATAMRAGMTARDLEHLELAYAPPFNSAKDPVNMAGFVASNMLRGDVKIVHAEDLLAAAEHCHCRLDTFRVVDVRSTEEFARGHLRGAVNIPLGQLRDAVAAGKLGQGDDAKPVLVYCWVGYRGYIAYRVLLQMGYNVVNLDGGFKNVMQGGYATLCEEKPKGTL